MTLSPTDLLSAWLGRQLTTDATQWLDKQRKTLAADYSDRMLFITLGRIPRFLGKADLVLDDESLNAARKAREGWDPRSWNLSDAARVLILIETALLGEKTFSQRYSDLCRNADVGELIALYYGLPLFPDAQLLEPQAAEGLRTNITPAFEAIAYHNPYPCDYFDSHRWNQMVMKTLFIGGEITSILGLDKRANPDLARMLIDHIYERCEAGRPINPDVWRCIGPFADHLAINAFRRYLSNCDESARHKAVLALNACESPGAQGLLESVGYGSNRGAFQ